MEFFIGWILFGVASAALAKGKGRNLILWFFLGLLIGPFAMLIQAFLPTTEHGDQDYQ
jgi:hypothetical protein